MNHSQPSEQEKLLSHLLHEQLVQWRQGSPVAAEHLLKRYPTLECDAEAVVDVVYREFCLREELGEAPDTAEYLQRFPKHAETLKRQFEVHAVMANSSSSGSDAEFAPTELRPLGSETSPPRTSCEDRTGTISDRTSDSKAPSLDPGTIAGARIPSTIGRYRVHRLIGRGAFGMVYLATDDSLERDVVIKVPNERMIATDNFLDMYRSEARTLAQVDHPNIVSVYDVGSDKTCPVFAVFQYIRGQDLAARMQERWSDVGETVRIVSMIADALHHAHARGIIHRDIKPGNILVDLAGTPFVADFGLAVREHEQRLRAGEIGGSPAYMSPEQIRGEAHHLDGRSDIWSLGVVLYQLLTRRLPFQGDGIRSLLSEIQQREPRPPRMIDDSLPRELEQICLKCLSKPVERRYTTARDLAMALQPFSAERVADCFQETKCREEGRSRLAELRYAKQLVDQLESRKSAASHVLLPVTARLTLADDDNEDAAREASIASSWGLDAPFHLLEPQSHRDATTLPTRDARNPYDNVLEACREIPRFVLLGTAGAGKTAALQKIALEHARSMLGEDGTSRVPLPVQLASWPNALPFTEFVARHLKSCGLIPQAPVVSANVLWLLDGLNELGPNVLHRVGEVREWLQSGPRDQHVVIACRSEDYSGHLDLGLPTVTIRPLDDSHVEQLAEAYLGAEKSAEFLVWLGADSSAGPETTSFAALCRSPFLLTCFLVVFATTSEQSLPGNPGQLLDRVIQSLWERERLRNAAGWIPYAEMRGDLSRLALYMVENDQAALVSIGRIGEIIESPQSVPAYRTAQLLRVEEDRIGFEHQLLRDYFAAQGVTAEALLAYIPPLSVTSGRRLSTRWDHVAILRAGLADNADNFVAVLAHFDPLLAAMCESNGACISDRTHRAIAMEFERQLRDPDPELRALAASSIADFSYCKAAEAIAERLYDENSLVRAVAARSLGRLRISASISDMLDRLSSPDETRFVKRHIVVALGALGRDGISGLVRTLSSEDEVLRETAAEALFDIGRPAVEPLSAALKSRNADVCGIAADLLGRIGGPGVVNKLADRLSDRRKIRMWNGERVCDVAAEALANIGSPDALKKLQRLRRKR